MTEALGLRVKSQVDKILGAGKKQESNAAAAPSASGTAETRHATGQPRQQTSSISGIVFDLALRIDHSRLPLTQPRLGERIIWWLSWTGGLNLGGFGSVGGNIEWRLLTPG